MIAKFFKSMTYAVKGIFMGIKEERNVRIDLVAMCYVFWLSTFYSFTKSEYALLIFICFAVPAFELMNTAVERTVKNPTADRYMIAGEAKDTAAGSVLVAALGALAAGVLLFWDIDVFLKIFKHFTQNIFNLIILILSLLWSYFFITIDKYSSKNKKG